MLPAEQLRCGRVRELADLERARRVTAVTGRSELGLMYVDMTRDALRARSSKVDDARGQRPVVVMSM